MTQKQGNGLVTHPEVPLRGPFLPLPVREGVERLSRTPARRILAQRQNEISRVICRPGQRASQCGVRAFWKQGLVSEVTGSLLWCCWSFLG